MTNAADATPVTFEAGYEELRRIVARLDADDVSVHEMVELFARGKGLEQALHGYLTTQQGRIDEIEAGQGLPEFVVVAPGSPGPGAQPGVPDAAASPTPTPTPTPAPAAVSRPVAGPAAAGPAQGGWSAATTPPAPEPGARIAFRAQRLTPSANGAPGPGTPEHEADLPF